MTATEQTSIATDTDWTMKTNVSVMMEVNPHFYHLIGLTELLVFLVGVPLNVAVLCMTCGGGGSSWHRTRRSITETLIISMAIADLGFCALHSPVMFATYFLYYRLPQTPCMLLYAATHVSTIASSLSLLCLNINKFLQLHKPLHYYMYVTKTRALASIVIGWGVSLLWGLLFVYGPFITYDQECNAVLSNKWLYVFFTIEFFILPTLVSLLVNVHITLVVFEKERRFLSNDHSGLTAVCVRFRRRHDARRRSDVASNGRRCGRRRQPLSGVRQIGFVFATTIWSAVTMLPYRLAFIANNVIPDARRDVALVYMSLCFFALMSLNAAGNPAITLFSHKLYSTKAGRCLRCLWGRSPSQQRRRRQSRYDLTQTCGDESLTVLENSLKRPVPPCNSSVRSTPKRSVDVR